MIARFSGGTRHDVATLDPVWVFGSRELAEYAILIVRVALGLFFAISGANKLFVPSQTQTMYETLVAANVPFPHVMTYFVSSVEFVGGLMLMAGFLTSLACLYAAGRYGRRYPYHQAIRAAQKRFTAKLARQLSVSSGSTLHTFLRLADLLRPWQIQR